MVIQGYVVNCVLIVTGNDEAVSFTDEGSLIPVSQRQGLHQRQSTVTFP